MTLGIFLSLGESFTSLRKEGQASLMIEQNIRYFAQHYNGYKPDSPDFSQERRRRSAARRSSVAGVRRKPLALARGGRHFRQVYVFTYKREKVSLPPNCTLVLPPFNLHRYIYALLLPFIHRHLVRDLDCIRCYHLSGTVPALVAKYFFGRKLVFNLGYDYQAFAQIEGKPFIAVALKVLEPLALKAAHHLIVKSRTLFNRLSPRERTKASFIPNGVDTNHFKPARRKKSSLSTILFVGRFERQKNLQNLIRAVSQVKTPALLRFVGSGSLESLLKAQAKVLKVPLKIHPPVSHRELVKVYHQASIFVLPSLKEGSPKVLLEAMSCGLPCIVSNIPEHREIIQHQKTGMISQPTSLALAKHIQKVLRHKSLGHQLGVKARQHIVKNFNIKRILKQELACLDSLWFTN